MVFCDPAHFALCTASAAGGPRFAAVLSGDRVIAVDALAALCQRDGMALRGAHSVLALLEHWEHNFLALQHALKAANQRAHEREFSQKWLAVEHLSLHAPLLPRQIFCSGANYRKHVIDLIIDDVTHETEGMTRDERRRYAEGVMDRRAASGKPFVFTKIASSLAGPFDTVVVPYDAKKPDWELELGVVIGKPARRVARADALDHVAGYLVANDLTERSLVFRPDIPQMGMDWLASKNAPGYLPIGPALVPAAFAGDPQDLRLTLKLNGTTMQDESTADMIFPVARLIEFISAHVQLMPGDLICTGSPAGNGTHYGRFLRDGDVMEASITGLGTQRTAVAIEPLHAASGLT